MPVTNVIIPTAWLTHLLDDFLGGSLGTMEVEVFTNNHTIVDSSVIGDFVLGSAGTIAAAALGTWGPSSLVSLAAWAYATASITFTNTGGSPVSVFGYIVFDGSGNPLWGQNDPNAPITVSASGGTYKLTPGFSLQSEF